MEWKSFPSTKPSPLMKNLLFGTDYPQEFSLGNESDTRLYVRQVRELPLNGADADKDMALGLNAPRLCL